MIVYYQSEVWMKELFLRLEGKVKGPASVYVCVCSECVNVCAVRMLTGPGYYKLLMVCIYGMCTSECVCVCV